jgi:hypothetical protein
MMKPASGAQCVFEPAGLRSAYIALFLLCLVGVAAVAVDILVPHRQTHSGPFMTSSVHQVLATATAVA